MMQSGALGNLLHNAWELVESNRVTEAEEIFRKVRAVAGDHPRVVGGLSECLRRSGRPLEAIEGFRKALKSVPQDHILRAYLAEAQRAVGWLDEAERNYEEAIRLNPTAFRLPVVLAVMQLEMGHFSKAMGNLKRAYALNPHDPVLLANLMTTLNRGGPPLEALEFARKYLGLPDAPPAITNWGKYHSLAIAQWNAGDIDGALASLDQAQVLSPVNPDLDFCRAMMLLSLGEYRTGLELVAKRTDTMVSPANRLPKDVGPEWTDPSLDIAGKRVHVITEQGVGDAIQFARYLPALARRGVKVSVGCSELVAPLLASVEGVIGAGKIPPAHDLSILMFDLPRMLGLQDSMFETPMPYLHPDAERLAKMRGHFAKVRGSAKKVVGLCWSGNPKQPVNARRALDPQLLSPLLRPDFQFVSLQKVPLPNVIPPKQIVDVTAHLTDFADTAAMIAAVDLFITTDTSVAHLAGAMGIGAWVLLHHPAPHWPFGLSGESSAWYPSLRLFRQSTPGEWAGVMAAVKAELLKL